MILISSIHCTNAHSHTHIYLREKNLLNNRQEFKERVIEQNNKKQQHTRALTSLDTWQHPYSKLRYIAGYFALGIKRPALPFSVVLLDS
jgi:hypothetical protein